MTSGPIVVQVLEGENAIAKNRALMVPTQKKRKLERFVRTSLVLMQMRFMAQIAQRVRRVKSAYFFRVKSAR